MRPLTYVLLTLVLISNLESHAQYSDSLRTVLNDKAVHDTVKIKVLKDLAYQYIWISPDTAIQLSKQMLSLSEKLNDTKQQIRAYRRLGMAYEQKGELDTAYTYFRLAMNLRQQTQDPTIIELGYESYAGLMIQKGQYDSALVYYDSAALYISKGAAPEKKMASVYNNKAVVYYYIGDFPNALDHYLLSMRLEEQVGNHEGVADTKNNIGLLYHRTGELDKATAYLQEAYQYHEAQGHPKPLNSLGLLEALASVESDKGNYEEAMRLFTEVVERSRILDIPNRIAIALTNRGIVHIRRKAFDQGIADYEEAIRILREIDAIQDLQNALVNLMGYYADLGRVDEVIQVGEEVLELNQKSPSIVEATLAYHKLYLAYKEKGKSTKALQMLEEHVVRRDSMESKETYKKLADLEFAYQARSDSLAQELALSTQKRAYEKRQNQTYLAGGILLFLLILAGIIYRNHLRKQALRKETERAVLEFKQVKSEMKALRSQMNPHFIFSSLQSIHVFMLNEKLEGANEYLLKFSKLMRKVLENSEFEEVPIEQDREALELYIQLEKLRLTQPFTYSIHIDEEIDQEEVCIPPLILQPFIENAIWHGLQHKKGPGNLSLSIRKFEGKLSCVIEDNGVGRNFVPPFTPFDRGKKKSMGLKITQERLHLRDQRTNTESDIHIVDLTDEEGTPCGTRVELIISLVA